MSRRCLGTTIMALLALLAVPSPGHASIWDWIWTMSGPQLVGVVFHCEIDWEHKDPKEYDLYECRIVDRRVTASTTNRRQERRTWLSLDTGAYTSTGHNSEGTDYKKFKDNMIAFEPIIEVRSLTSAGGNFMMHHGVIGASYDVLFGDFDTFDNFGFKFRPIGVTGWKKVNASLIVRYYPREFTKGDFGFDPSVPNVHEDGEWTWGFSFGFLWGPSSVPRSQRK